MDEDGWIQAELHRFVDEDGSTGQLINFSVVVVVNFRASSFFVELRAKLDALGDDTFDIFFYLTV